MAAQKVVPATPQAAESIASAPRPVAPIDRYTVVAGDTLAGIAAKPDVYGDSRLWPLLQRANSQQLGPQGLIFPKQVLMIDRTHSAADVSMLTGRSPAGSVAAPGGSKSPAPVVPIAQSAVVAVAPPATPPRAAQPAGPGLADFLLGARNAFAAGDLAWAAYYYSVYLERRNNDEAAWGELGNVYYQDGNLTDAARAFYNSANLLIDKGYTARALDLLPAIQEGDPALADALLLRLTTVRK